MGPFKMCGQCLTEYCNPLDRRFHSQTNCCAECGPVLELKDERGRVLESKDSALKGAIRAIRRGATLAVQGIGGFHLFCDATNDLSVKRLRQVKGRESKPFAILVRDLEQARGLCQVSECEERLLCGKGAPIVLLRRSPKPRIELSPSVAPGLIHLGILLPYSPIHSLILGELDHPVVATSANVSDDPICYDQTEALIRLKGMADFFLVHNRRIASRVDDSVVREIAGTEVVFRAGRGYAPYVIHFSNAQGETPNHPKHAILALGGHQKNTIAVGHSGEARRIVLMPHIGNLESPLATEAYQDSILNTQRLFDLGVIPGLKARVKEAMEEVSLRPVISVSDLHPNYRSTQLGQARDPSLLQIQHHEAHILSCIAEHQIRGEVLGVAWDGSGYGRDGSIWGGEFFRATERGAFRIGSLRQFQLVGGAAAIKEPRRSALGLLYEIFGERTHQPGPEGRGLPRLDEEAHGLGFEERELRNLLQALKQNVNSPLTSSMGRVFDAAAALTGIRVFSEYEGQAALELESAVSPDANFQAYPVQIKPSLKGEVSLYSLREETLARVDWEPWVVGMLTDRTQGLPPAQIAAKFHRTLVEVIVTMARRFGIFQVVLSGGCFQNRILGEWAVKALREDGFSPFWNQRVPPNDGGISVGQVMGGWDVLISSG